MREEFNEVTQVLIAKETPLDQLLNHYFGTENYINGGKREGDENNLINFLRNLHE